MKDLHNNIKVLSAIAPAAIVAADATKTSAIIDTKDFKSLEFAVQSGAITDGTFTGTVYESDADDMTGETAVAAADLIGTAPVFIATEDNVVKKVGYIGTKRYVRIKMVQSGATTGGFISAQAIQGDPRVAPVA